MAEAIKSEEWAMSEVGTNDSPCGNAKRSSNVLSIEIEILAGKPVVSYN
jgi:hypothetical protein